MTIHRLHTVAATGVFLLLLSGCSWKRAFTSRAPDGNSRIEIFEAPALADARVRVELITQRGRVLLYDERTDWVRGFSKVEWVGSHRVGVYLCNQIGDPLLVGYDLQSRLFLDRNTVQEALRRGIEADYGVEIARSKGEDDPLEWACSHDGGAAFDAHTKSESAEVEPHRR